MPKEAKATEQAIEYAGFINTVHTQSKATNSHEVSTSQLAENRPEDQKEPITVLDNVQITVKNKFNLDQHIEKLTQNGK